ncbi:MAG TPA: DegT/DnrJ/EryC1/StrS family aminotransferase [Pirellulales bacterium]|jgi:aminotransferase EvaB|nr:DegT/DnrJ/EryC1/StrS family aminotransferase [Pirellulales bacterium]
MSAAEPIPLFDYRPQLQRMRAEMLDAITEVLDSGKLILGPQVQAFEREFARFLSAPEHAVGVASGTDSVALALRALGVGPGDEVITVANTAVPTISAIRMVGAVPVFCDIDPQTLLMDVADAARRVTRRTRAIVPVHPFGNVVDMPAVIRLAADRELHVVEDCAHSTGATLNGRHTGTFGDAACFSFYPTKTLGAYGDGGLCLARSAELAEALRTLRMFGTRDGRIAVREGVTSRLDELQAAILRVKLRHLHDDLAARRAIAARYRDRLDQRVATPCVAPGVEHAYHLMVIQMENRARVIERLEAEHIGYGIHYPQPIHLMPAYRFLDVAEGSLPVTERAAKRVLSLPCWPGLHEEQVERVCHVVNAALG